MSVKPYSKAIVQILVNGNLVGTGVLVAYKYILTCAHVLKDDDISVAFNLLEEKPKLKANIYFKTEGEEIDGTHMDIALLELEQSFPDINYQLAEIESENLSLEIYGYDVGEGRWTTAKYRGKNDAGWGQVSFENDKNLEGGFSGAPAWNIVNNIARIVGVVVAKYKDKHNNAYIIPVSAILKIKKVKELLGNQLITEKSI